ncbi:hemerythrin domain-containing protein [Streptomyces sp. 110]|uniref:Hemerythrin domain-containing protein n=1 Tax=Streptomyces endocoffeicus TaxID=2898945 RepID=A0ABS1PPL1_9ACTN|nr:hemerythrin domain-containing protein [Streptomyces endocoffeicus]MBL1114009.1 hemerythrin domain-containing protein [Streptomyces endocoffeicus]
MAKQNTRPADSRDMYAVHTMFRREFGALPALIRRVTAHDGARARIVADHVALLVDLLHVHHRSEDDHCWPKLAGRGPQDVAPIVELMRSQHQVVDAALQATERRTAVWRASATAEDRDALADTIDGMLPPLGEHLEAEEERMLPLIDRYLTADEWADVGNKGLGNVPRAKIPVLFGMLLRDASAEQRALFKEAVPTPVFTVMSRVGPIALKRYQRKVFAAR